MQENEAEFMRKENSQFMLISILALITISIVIYAISTIMNN